MSVNAGKLGFETYSLILTSISSYFSKRLRHQRKKEKHDLERGDETSSGEESDDEDEEEHEMNDLDKYRRQQSIMSNDSFRLPMWQEVDQRIKATVSSSLIDTKALKLGNVLGKGKFNIIQPCKYSEE